MNVLVDVSCYRVKCTSLETNKHRVNTLVTALFIAVRRANYMVINSIWRHIDYTPHSNTPDHLTIQNSMEIQLIHKPIILTLILLSVHTLIRQFNFSSQFNTYRLTYIFGRNLLIHTFYASKMENNNRKSTKTFVPIPRRKRCAMHVNDECENLELYFPFFRWRQAWRQDILKLKQYMNHA